MQGKEKFYPPEVGEMSLIGVRSQPPVSWGNYFSLRSGPRVLNMWAENLNHVVSQGLIADNKLRVIDYGNYCIIDDIRIPEEYYYNKLCFTGGPRVSVEHAKEIYGYIGDPENELEQFTDPVSYYEKEGGTYDPNTGSVYYKFGKKPRPILTKKENE